MMISIRSLSKSFTGPEGKIIHALRDCSLDIAGGSFTVIIGKSGSGKTTLLKLIAGLEQPDSGAVEFEGAPKLGFMFQDPRLLPWLTVEQNLALAFPPSKSKAEKAAVRNEIMRILSLTGLGPQPSPSGEGSPLDGRAASMPHELSGGMAQRVALARCLCRNPAVLLLDEPLCSLDTFNRIHLRNELEKLRQHLGLTVILVTHDIEEAVFFGDRIFLLNEGKLEGEISIPLKRPRDYRNAEFQDNCRRIESALIKGDQ